MMAVGNDTTFASEEEVWQWLGEVPDPEIPVVSVVELGIVRAIAWEKEKLTITVTPTYSGCPATSVIAFDIAEAMRRHGVRDVEVKSQLSPAWTTAWMSETAREKLREYGIAPPIEGQCIGASKAALVVDCPRCGSSDTERISQFGSTPCKAHYRCKACLEPFDYFKSF